MAVTINASTTSGLVMTSDLSGTLSLQSNGVAITVPAVAGTMMVSGNMPAFSYYQSSATSVSANTFTKISFQTSNFDTTTGMYASSRFTPTVAGYYQINGGVGVATAASRIITTIYKNGSVYQYGNDNGAASTANTGTVSGLVYCNGSTDYIEIYVFFGTAQNTAASSVQTYFSGCLVRAS